MKSIARSLVWINEIDNDIEQFVKTCFIFQSVRANQFLIGL